MNNHPLIVEDCTVVYSRLNNSNAMGLKIKFRMEFLLYLACCHPLYCLGHFTKNCAKYSQGIGERENSIGKLRENR